MTYLMLWDPARLNLNATWRHVAVVALWLASMCVHARDNPANEAETTSAIAGHDTDFGAGETPTSRAAIRDIIESETAKADLPADIAEAVVFVESGYNPTIIGSAGEVGLMQVRPETAAMLGFRGNGAELVEPATNIHYGVALSQPRMAPRRRGPLSRSDEVSGRPWRGVDDSAFASLLQSRPQPSSRHELGSRAN